LQRLCEDAQGYLYYVSFAGVTGASERLNADAAAAHLHAIRNQTRVPMVAGFGIRDAASAAAMAEHADGVVIGSALVSKMAECVSSEDAARVAAEFVRAVRLGIDAEQE